MDLAGMLGLHQRQYKTRTGDHRSFIDNLHNVGSSLAGLDKQGVVCSCWSEDHSFANSNNGIAKPSVGIVEILLLSLTRFK